MAGFRGGVSRRVLLAVLALRLAGNLDGAPPLEVARLPNGNLELAWPAADTGFVLEERTTLDPGSVWVTLGQSPQVQGARQVVVIPPASTQRYYRLRGNAVPALATIVESSPAASETGVAVTRETVLRLSAPLGPASFLGPDTMQAVFGGRRLLSRAELSSDRRTLTLFYLEDLPASARVTVELDAAGLVDAAGALVDADGDGQPGGRFRLSFDTSGTVGIPGTAVVGHVYAAAPDAGGANVPLANVTITVDGAEETMRTTTDASGYFRLEPVPAGRFFVHVDGRTAVGSDWPRGAYYPFVGKAWEAVPGRTTNLAGGTGEIFLPRVSGGALTPVSAVAETVVRMPSSEATNAALAGVEVRVPANALFSENGARGGQVGLAAVPPERLPEPLPPGLNLPLVITIQTDGPQNFDRPVPVRFPNLPDPVTGVLLPPGAKTVLWSFNHDTGRWEAQGTATVTADGLFVETDPGVGVRQPGWHGVASGSNGSGPGPTEESEEEEPPPDEPEKDPCDSKAAATWLSAGDLALDALFTAGGGIKDPVAGCAFGAGVSASRTLRDCLAFSSDQACVDSQKNNVIGTGLGCIPVVGGILGLGWGAKGLIDASFDWYDCEQNQQLSLQRRTGTPAEARSGVRLHSSAKVGLGRAAGYLDQQMALARAASNLVATIYGASAWSGPQSPQDVAPYRAIMVALVAAVDPASPGGVTVTEPERNQLAGLPRPSNVNPADLQAAITRVQAIVAPVLDPALRAELAAAYQGFLDVAEPLFEDDAWPHYFYGLEQALLELSSISSEGDIDRDASSVTTSEAARARQDLSAPVGEPPMYRFPRRALRYRLLNLDNGFEMRGRLNVGGRFEGVVLAPDALYRVDYLDPVTLRGGHAWFRSAGNGETTVIPAAMMLEVTTPDTDGDGLPDAFEAIVGTLPDVADTDGDGASDGAELRNGLNPLDGLVFELGVVGSTGTPGYAEALAADRGLAVVLEQEGRALLFDVSNTDQPVRLGDLQGVGNPVGVAMRWPLVAVAQGHSTGLGPPAVYLFDVANPASPMLRWQWPSPVQTLGGLAIARGRVFASLVQSGTYVLDAGTGEQQAFLPEGFEKLSVLGDLLAGVGSSGSTESSVRLFRILEDDPEPAPLGIVVVPGGASSNLRPPWLFLEPDHLYVGTRDGYRVLDTRDPLNPVRLDETQPSGLGIRLEVLSVDAGHRLLATTRTAEPATLRVALYDASDPTTSTNALGALDTPGNSEAVWIYQGRALIADGPGGLAVLNYREPDLGAVAPTLTLEPVTTRRSPPEQEASGLCSFLARASDDTSVREVEFFVDSQSAGTDGSHPFELELRAPAYSPTKTNFTVRARATDLGGRSAWSDPLTVALVDTRPPRLIRRQPADATFFLSPATVAVTAQFSEPLANASLASGLRVTEAGSDGLHDTADDVGVPAALTVLPDDAVGLVFAGPLPKGAYRVRATAALVDFQGNPLANPTNWHFGVREPLVWTAGDSGLWGTPANWSETRLPNTNDFVRIDAPAEAVVTLQPSPGVGSLYAYTLASTASVVLQGGVSVELGHQAEFHGPLRVGTPGSQSTEASIQGGLSIVRQGMTLEGGLTLRDHTLVIDAPGVASAFSNSDLFLSAYLQALGSQLILQPGSVLDTHHADGLTHTWNLSDKQSGIDHLGLLRKWGTGTLRVTGAGTFRNQGTLVVDAGRVEVGAVVFENLGTIEVRPGATLRSGSIFPPTHHGRTARVTGGGTNWIGNRSVYDGEYGFEGTTLLEGESKEFNGGVRNAGPWSITGNPVTVRGRFADFSGPVTLGGAGSLRGTLRLQAGAEARLQQLQVVEGELGGSGRIRIASPLVLSNRFSLTATPGPLAIRFDGPLELASLAGNTPSLDVGADVAVEFAAAVHWPTGRAGLTTNCLVLPGTTFTVSGSAPTLNAAVAGQAGLEVRGVYRKTGEGTNRLQRVVNSGQVEVLGGTLQSLLSSASGAAGVAYRQTGGSLVLAGGTLDLRIGSESSATPGSMEIHGGEVIGTNQVTADLTCVGGVIRPGLPAGLLAVNGSVTFGANGALAVEIGGLQAGTEHDQLQATTCDFDGRLEVSLINGYQPRLGDEFTIATYTGRSARTFREATGLSIGGGRQFELVYSPTSLKLRVIAGP